MTANRSIRIETLSDQMQWDNFNELKNRISYCIDNKMDVDNLIIAFFDACLNTQDWAIKWSPWIHYIFQLIVSYCSVDVIKLIHNKYSFVVPYPKTLLKIYSKMSFDVNKSEIYKKLNDIEKLYDPIKLKFYDDTCNELIFQIMANIISDKKNLDKLKYLLDKLPTEWYLDIPIFMSRKLFIAATSDSSQCTTSMYHELYNYFGEKHCIAQWILDTACCNNVTGIIEWYKAHTGMCCSIGILYSVISTRNVNAAKTILSFFPSSDYNLIDRFCECYHEEKTGYSNIKSLQKYRYPWLLPCAKAMGYTEIVNWFNKKK